MTSFRDHPFIRSPHYTLIFMSFPVLLSLIAEPVTGLVDTAFVSRLGAGSLAGLGVGTMALSSVFWVFNFLGIGTQTEVAQAHGRQAYRRIKQLTGLAFVLSGLFGVLVVVIGLPGIAYVATLMQADGLVHDQAVSFMQIRLFGAPAVIATLAAFGIFRGLQDMRTPLWIAVSINALNMLLDPVLIFGFGPIQSMGIAGAALASVISQWLGVIWAMWAVYKRLGFPDGIQFRDARKLLNIGGYLLVRTGLLIAFLFIPSAKLTTLTAAIKDREINTLFISFPFLCL